MTLEESPSEIKESSVQRCTQMPSTLGCNTLNKGATQDIQVPGNYVESITLPLIWFTLTYTP